MAGRRRGAWLALGWVLLGCAGSSTGRAPLQQATGLERHSGGHVALIRRPTEGFVHLALWIDAGSRDARVPQLAVLAAHLAARRGGDLEAHVIPDGIELSRLCRRERLGACAEQLRRALAARDPTRQEVRSLKAQLVELRARAAAADPNRAAGQLALRALLGPAAEGFIPWGRAERDEELTRAQLAAFVADHFGPERALLVASGDVTDAERVRRVVHAVFAGAPAARRPRAARQLRPGPHDVRVAWHDRNLVAVALAAPELGVARGWGERALDALGAGASGHAFQVRGGALLMAHGPSREPVMTVRELGRALRRPLEPLERRATAPSGTNGSLQALARAKGSDWVAGGGGSSLERAAPRVGVGVLLRGDGPSSPRQVALRRAERRRARAALGLRESLRDGLEPARLEGRVGGAHASVQLSNGARLEVRRRQGARVGLALRVAGGSLHEPAASHGRSALLASLLTSACRDRAAPTLARELRLLDATLTPYAGARSWGVSLDAPAERWRRALELTLHCVVHPSWRAADVAEARRRALERVARPASAGWFAARAARLIAPSQPGLVAPWGSPRRIPTIGVAELARSFERGVTGNRLAVAAVGPVAPRAVTEQLAAALETLPAGTRPAPPEGDPKPLSMEAEAERWPRARPGAVVAWRVDRQPAPGLGAAALLQALEQQLQRGPGSELLWSASGSAAGSAWLAVGLSLSERALAGLDARVQGAMQRAGEGDLGRHLTRARSRKHRARVLARAAAPAQAAQIAERALGRGAPASARSEALALGEQLAASHPRFLVLRP